MILAERNARVMAETNAAVAAANAAVAQAEAAKAQADLSSSEALIAHLKLAIEKLRRELYGTRSERKARLLEQMELQLEDLEAAATEDALAAEKAAARTQTVKSFQRKRPSRKPFPDHLPRERIVIAAPESCPCCGSAKLSKLGEDITETLEVIPRQWKVIQTVREKFTCRECDKITCKNWYSIFRTLLDHAVLRGDVDDSSARVFTVKPRACGAPQSGIGA
jgi:transposase